MAPAAGQHRDDTTKVAKKQIGKARESQKTCSIHSELYGVCPGSATDQLFQF